MYLRMKLQQVMDNRMTEDCSAIATCMHVHHDMHVIAIITFPGLCGSTFYGFSALSTIIIPAISPC